jgi:hypothetical protein
MTTKKVLHNHWVAPYRAKAATITITTVRNPRLATFAVTLYVGGLHDARAVMRGRAPGIVRVERDFAKGDRLWLDYPDGIPAKSEAVASVQWEPARSDQRPSRG